VIKAFNKRFPEGNQGSRDVRAWVASHQPRERGCRRQADREWSIIRTRALMQPLATMFRLCAAECRDYNHDAQISPTCGRVRPWSVDRLQQAKWWVGKGPASRHGWIGPSPEYDRMTGQVVRPSARHHWTRIMFERLMIGEDYWAKEGDHIRALSVGCADGG